MTKNTRLYYCSSSSGVDSINSAAEAFEAAPKIGDMIKEDGSIKKQSGRMSEKQLIEFINS